VIALRMLGLFLLLPVFMVLARDVPGYSPQVAGLAVGIYGLTQAVLQQPFGWLSDRWGRRPVMLLGLILFAAGGVMAALADSIAWVVAGRALQGCGAIAGVAMAFDADLTRPERRPIVMAVIGMGIGAAFLLSIMLAVPLSTLLGLSGLFWLTVVLAILGMALVLTVPSTPPARLPPSTLPRGLAAATWLLSFSVFLLHLVMTLFFVVLPPWLIAEFELALDAHWKLYLPAILLSVVIMLPLLRRAGRQASEHRLLPLSFVGLAAALFGIPMQGGVFALAAVITLYFLCFNLLEAAMPSLLSRLTGARGRGSRLGRYTSFQFLGAFVGGVAGGLLVATAGEREALMLAAILCLAWGGLIALVSRRVFLTGGLDRL
jgi:MFS family permease